MTGAGSTKSPDTEEEGLHCRSEAGETWAAWWETLSRGTQAWAALHSLTGSGQNRGRERKKQGQTEHRRKGRATCTRPGLPVLCRTHDTPGLQIHAHTETTPETQHKESTHDLKRKTGEHRRIHMKPVYPSIKVREEGWSVLHIMN